MLKHMESHAKISSNSYFFLIPYTKKVKASSIVLHKTPLLKKSKDVYAIKKKPHGDPRPDYP